MTDEGATRSDETSLLLSKLGGELDGRLSAISRQAARLSTTELDAHQTALLEQIKADAASLLTLLGDVRDYARIRAGDLAEYRPRPFDAGSVVEEVADQCAGVAHNASVELVCFVAENYPVWVEGDPILLRRILLNLVEHALRFSVGGTVSVALTAVESGEVAVRLRFEVRHASSQIPESRLEDLFRPFAPLGDWAGSGSSAGLGLAISHEICRFLDGSIGVDNDKGRGISYWVSLPFLGVAKAPYSSLTLPLPPVGSWVLVVDNCEPARTALTRYLRAARLRVASASDGHTALELMAQAHEQGQPFELVFIDRDLPSFSGAELAQRLEDDPTHCDVPRVSLESPTAPGTTARRQPNFNATLVKPLKRLPLLETVERLLRRAVERRSDPNLGMIPGAGGDLVPEVPRLLVAEADFVNRRVLKQALEALGCEVDLVDTGAAAVEAATSRVYSAVLLNVSIPRIDGYQAAIHIREREGVNPRVPIVAIGPPGRPEERQRYLHAGMNDYLATPVSEDDLRAMLALLPLARGPQIVVD